MTSKMTRGNLDIFYFYQELIAYSQNEAHIRVRKSAFMYEANTMLSPYGGMKNWLVAHVIALLGTIIFNLLPFVWAEIISLCFAVVFSSMISLHNLTAFLCDMYTFLNGQETEEYIYKNLVERTFSKFGVFIMPTLLVIITLLLSWQSLHLAHQFFGVVAITTLVIFIANQFAHSIKNIKDYYRVIAAFLGLKSVIVKNKEELTITIYEYLLPRKLTEDQLTKLRSLAQFDLRLAEIRVEITNLTIAFFAILISILFSVQLVNLLASMFSWISSLFHLLGVQLSNQFEFGIIIAELFTRGVFIALWWQLLNLLAGLGVMSFNLLASIYYFYYIPAYALHRSLFLIDSVPTLATTPAAPSAPRFFAQIISLLSRRD